MTYDGSLQGPALEARHRMADLYEQDLVIWAEEQEKALLELRIDDIDFENVAEEIRCFGIDQSHEFREHLRSLITTLLKWKYLRKLREEHEYVTATWYVQIGNDRIGIEVPLDCSPSLQSRVPEFLAKEYPRALWRASMETGLKESLFPQTFEWTLDEMMGFPLDPLTREDTIRGSDLVLSREIDMWEAYSPDFSCIAFGRTPEEAKLNYADVLAEDIERLREIGDPVPEPSHPVDEDDTFGGRKGEYDWSQAVYCNGRPHHEVLAELHVVTYTALSHRDSGQWTLIGGLRNHCSAS
jgi:predicted RNase H-like HicB family nuclease